MESESENSASSEGQPRGRRVARSDDSWSAFGPVNQRCSHCGRVVSPGEWHPVATDRAESGELAIHDFCDEDCLAAWERDYGT